MYHYDSLPYASDPFAETHPQTLAMLAQLLGLAATPPTACRVLELGCAGGGNLIPMAWHLRDSQFVGIDLEQAQIDTGRALIDELGLCNIELRQGDIATLGDDLGTFDYVIAHGVFSWIPAAVRDALLALYKRVLRPNGIGYISYNTSPGWHVRGMLREMLLFHTQGITDSRQGLDAAQQFLALYAETLRTQTGALSRHLLLEVEALRTAHPSYLYHEYLEVFNQPLLFRDFVELAQSHGLRYLCESRLEAMFPSGLGKMAAEFLESVDDSTRSEQYLDFFAQRTFRQSLLVHDDVRPDLDIDLERLADYACASNLVPPTRLNLRRSTPQVFVSQDGKEVRIGDAQARAMLAILHDSYPSALPLGELAAQAAAAVGGGRAGQPGGTGWHSELFGLYANGLVQLQVRPTVFDNSTPVRPRLHALARAWLAQGAPNLPTLRHQPLNIDAFARHLAGCLDGEYDRDALVQQMVDDVRHGALVLPGKAIDPHQLRSVVAANVDRLLALFAHNGLFEAG